MDSNNLFFATASQPTVSFKDDELLLIAEALDHYGYNLLYAHEYVDMHQLTDTAKLHEKILNYLDKDHPTIATSVN